MSSDLSQLVADAAAQTPAAPDSTLAELWQRIMPWEDLQAKSPPERYLQLGRDVLAAVAALSALGPDRPRLLRTDGLSRLLTATAVNPELPVTGPAAVNATLIPTSAQYIAPPGTSLLLTNAAGLTQLVQVTSWPDAGHVQITPALVISLALGDSGTVIPDMEYRSALRFVNSMTVSPNSTQSMDCPLPAGTKCVYVTTRPGSKPILNTLSVTGDQTGQPYYSGASMPGGQFPIAVDSGDDQSVTVSVTTGSGSPSGLPVFLYASLSNDLVYIATAQGQNVVTDPLDRATRALGRLSLRPYDKLVSNFGVAIGVQGTVTLPATANKAWTVAHLSYSWLQAGTTAAQARIQLADGGTVIWEKVIALPATTNTVVSDDINNVAIPIGLGNSAQLLFNAAAASTFQSVNLGGWLD